MNHYTIVLSIELLDASDYSGVVHSLGQLATDRNLRYLKLTHPIAGHGAHFITVIQPVSEIDDMINVKKDPIPVLWSELSSGVTFSDIVVHQVPICDGNSENPNEQLLLRIHELADNLPKIGIILDICWLVKDESLVSIDENVKLFGGMKRLLEWNNGAFTFVILSSKVEDKDKVEPWSTMLRGQVTMYNDLGHGTPLPLWRGSIVVAGSNIRKPIYFSGFRLFAETETETIDDDFEEVLKGVPKSDTPAQELGICSRILANKIEIIAQIDRTQVPLLYFTGKCYNLRLASDSPVLDKSRQLIQRLEDNHRLSYLVKLCYGTSWKNVDDESCFKDKERTERKSWSDYVQENIQNVLNCPILPELDGEVGQHVFLVCAKTNSDSNISVESYAAYLLRAPSDLSGHLSHDAVLSAMTKSTIVNPENLEDDKTRVEEILAKIPHMSGKQLLFLEKFIKDAQISALEMWCNERCSRGESVNISSDSLVSLLLGAFEKVINDWRKTVKLNKWNQDGNADELNNAQVVRPPIPNYEKLILAYHSLAETRFGRSKSCESLAGLSPPSRGKVLTLNATEFIKFFKKDGTASQERKAPVTLKKRNRRCFKNLQTEDLMVPWPQCENLQFHDIYYNNCDNEALEAKSKRLLNSFLTTETSSTCIYQPGNRATILPVVPVKQELQDKIESITKVTPERVRRLKITPERLTRSAKKKRDAVETMKKDTKRLYAAKKMELKAGVKAAVEKKSNAEKSEEQLRRESRSQRHKRKLEDIVKQTLIKEGIAKTDPLFKPCALRLYNITKSFVKDLTSSVGLKDEMLRIAESNAPMIVDFERKNPRNK